MINFQLTEIVTKDNLVHHGIFYKPTKPGKKALLWVHGLTGNFYGGMKTFEEFAKQCEKEDWGFASFNNRGHDMISGGRKLDLTNPKGYTHIAIGAGNEVFEECVYDIEAGINFLTKQGFSEIILIGQSSGANKVCYYSGTENNLHITGIILASPTSDRLVPGTDLARRQKMMMTMQKLVDEGKGNELVLGVHFFPITPKRYLNLFTPRSNEDTFDYGDANPEMKFYSQITKPLFVILGGTDESMDRPAEKIKSVFDAKTTAQKYKSVIIPDAYHNYNGQEQQFVKTVNDWVKSL